MGILNQLRYSFTKQRIDKEVDEKVDRLQEIIKVGGTKEELKEACGHRSNEELEFRDCPVTV